MSSAEFRRAARPATILRNCFKAANAGEKQVCFSNWTERPSIPFSPYLNMLLLDKSWMGPSLSSISFNSSASAFYLLLRPLGSSNVPN